MKKYTELRDLMPTRRLISLGLIGVWALSMVGCVSSIQPLCDVQQCEPDQDLLGVWEFTNQDSGECHKVSISASQVEPKLLQLRSLEPRQPDEEEKQFELYCSKLGHHKMLSIREISAEGKPKANASFSIFRYHVSDDCLKIMYLDMDYAIKAIEDGRLRGSVSTGKVIKIKSVTIEESPDELCRFLTEQGDKCFTALTQISIKRLDGLTPK